MIVPSPPTGLGDLALILQVIENKAEFTKRLKEIAKAQAAMEEAFAIQGKAEDVEKAYREIGRLRGEAERLVENARGKAREIIDEAHRRASPILADAVAKENEAARILVDAKADAQSRNEKCLVRERAAKAREDAADGVERMNEARDADLIRREGEVSAREAAVSARENKLRAALG